MSVADYGAIVRHLGGTEPAVGVWANIDWQSPAVAAEAWRWVDDDGNERWLWKPHTLTPRCLPPIPGKRMDLAWRGYNEWRGVCLSDQDADECNEVLRDGEPADCCWAWFLWPQETTDEEARARGWCMELRGFVFTDGARPGITHHYLHQAFGRL